MGGQGPPPHVTGAPYGGWVPPKISPYPRLQMKFLMAGVWFWVFYKIKTDGPVKFVSLSSPSPSLVLLKVFRGLWGSLGVSERGLDRTSDLFCSRLKLIPCLEPNHPESLSTSTTYQIHSLLLSFVGYPPLSSFFIYFEKWRR